MEANGDCRQQIKVKCLARRRKREVSYSNRLAFPMCAPQEQLSLPLPIFTPAAL